jgi:hypothetical protein
MRIYDVVMTHKLDADDLFLHEVQAHCAARRLTFFLIEPLWVESFRIYLELGEIWARVLLNMHSEHHDPEEVYHRLVRLAHDRHTRVIDPPEVAGAAFNKARMHARLLEAGVGVPFTVVVAQDQITQWQPTAAEREALGTPFVVKPSMGYGRRGVILDATHEGDLARSAAACRDAHYLVQRRVVPRALEAGPAWFRVFFAFGTVWVTWWNCYTDQYRMLEAAEVERYGLQPLWEIACRIAQLSGMRFFSTEVAWEESGAFVVVDYVNDQCHLLSQSANPRMGVPDELVKAIARRLVEGAQQLIGQRS